MPKQLLALTARESMMQLTATRTAARSDCAPPLIVPSARHADLIQDQLAAVGQQRAKRILEPMGRHTAPAIALAALKGETPAAPVLVDRKSGVAGTSGSVRGDLRGSRILKK